MAFKDNLWWTRKARIQAEKRLLANAFQSQVLLLWYSFFSVAVSVYYLKCDNSTTVQGLPGITWIVYSVLVLCVSGFINGLSFKERAGLIKECYETLNGLYQKAKLNDADIASLSEEYDQVMGVCENHTDKDYYIALCVEFVTCVKPVNEDTGLKDGLDRAPTWYHWFSLGWWMFRHYAMLAFFYLLPVFLFIGLETLN